MTSNQGIRPWAVTNGERESQNFSWLACFLRWSEHEGTAGGCGAGLPVKVEVRCRACGTHFVKYVYEKTVRCPECRAAKRRGSGGAGP